MRKSLIPFLALLLSTPALGAERDWHAERERMVLSVANLAATAGPSERSISRPVLDAMRRVPRHLLVPAEVRGRAYQNVPLPIGHGATISQPYIVALMTELLDARQRDIVLEVGTGSGYQAAVLSGLVRHVYTIEIVPELAERAAAQLRGLGYGNVTVRAGDGYAGWPEHGPFDRIIVTAAAPEIPPALIAQLRPGGRMVIPVARRGQEEVLMLVRKDSNGRVRSRSIVPVRFVPLVRGRTAG